MISFNFGYNSCEFCRCFWELQYVEWVYIVVCKMLLCCLTLTLAFQVSVSQLEYCNKMGWASTHTHISDWNLQVFGFSVHCVCCCADHSGSLSSLFFECDFVIVWPIFDVFLCIWPFHWKFEPGNFSQMFWATSHGRKIEKGVFGAGIWNINIDTQHKQFLIAVEPVPLYSRQSNMQLSKFDLSSCELWLRRMFLLA